MLLRFSTKEPVDEDEGTCALPLHRERKSLSHLYGTSRTLSSSFFFLRSFSRDQNRTVLRISYDASARVPAKPVGRDLAREERVSAIEGDK